MNERRLRLVGVVDSGGEMPIGLTADDGLLYVLHAGGSGNISGFRIQSDGSLVHRGEVSVPEGSVGLAAQ